MLTETRKPITSTSEFDTSPEQVDLEIENGIHPNPPTRFNPLGAIDDLTVLVISDTHYHIKGSGRASRDPTATLPTTRIRNRWREFKKNHPYDWHARVRPELFNETLARWPDTIEDFLTSKHADTPTKHILLVHGGDMGDDALKQDELGVAIVENQRAMGGIEDNFARAWGWETDVCSIYAPGNHDVDCRAWPISQAAHQLQWYNDKLGNAQQPACFLQEVGGVNAQKALLVVDTNLMESVWRKKVQAASAYALNRLLARGLPRAHINNMIEGVLNGELELSDMKGQTQKDVLTYPLILRHKAAQEAMIRRTQENYDQLTIIGHKPHKTLQVARGSRGHASVVAGDVHMTYDSGNTPTYLQRALPRTKGGHRVQIDGVGAATRGAVGVEWPGTATAKMITMGESNTTHTILNGTHSIT